MQDWHLLAFILLNFGFGILGTVKVCTNARSWLEKLIWVLFILLCPYLTGPIVTVVWWKPEMRSDFRKPS